MPQGNETAYKLSPAGAATISTRVALADVKRTLKCNLGHGTS